jgi:hypothetical protein
MKHSWLGASLADKRLKYRGTCFCKFSFNSACRLEGRDEKKHNEQERTHLYRSNKRGVGRVGEVLT